MNMSKKYLVGQCVYDASMASLKETAKRLDSLLAEQKTVLSEGKTIDREIAQQIMNEVIVYERLIILEAAGDDPRKMVDTLDGMLMAANQLAGRLHAGVLYDVLGKYTPPSDGDLDMSDVDMWAKDLPVAEKNKATGMVKGLQKSLADVGVITKALMAIADDIGSEQGGEGGALAEIMKTLSATKADKDAMLGQALDSYDKSVNLSKHPSMLKRMGGRLGKALGNSTSGLKQKFGSELKKLVQSKAPGAAKLIDLDALVEAIMTVPVERVARAFRAYNGSVMNYVDDDFLMKMSTGRGGIMGAIKGLADMFSGAGSAPSRG
jgi:hypothetical protein